MASAVIQRQPKKQKPSPNIWHGDTDISDDVAQHKAQVPCSSQISDNNLYNLLASTCACEIDLATMKCWVVQKHTWPMFFSLSYRCIGVIYGDLTTSPL